MVLKDSTRRILARTRWYRIFTAHAKGCEKRNNTAQYLRRMRAERMPKTYAPYHADGAPYIER